MPPFAALVYPSALLRISVGGTRLMVLSRKITTNLRFALTRPPEPRPRSKGAS